MLYDKQHLPRRPFAYCKALNKLLSAIRLESACTCCQQDQCYLANGKTLLHKRRPLSGAERRKLRNVKHSTAFQLENDSSKVFIPDSGATISATSNLDLFISIEKHSPGKRVQVANKSFVEIALIGTIRLNLLDEHNRPFTMLLSNVHYSPEFSGNLLSVHELYKQHRISTHFNGPTSYLVTPEGLRVPLRQFQSKEFQLQAFSAVDIDPILWHKRFMHCGTKAMQRMGCHIKRLARRDYDFRDCHACLQGGAKKIPFPSPSKRVTFAKSPEFQKRARRTAVKFGDPKFTKFGQRIASDLCGPFEESITGDKYAIVFHDSATKHVVIYTIPDKTKETVLGAFQQFLLDYQKQLPNGVGHFWTDNGGEYINQDMERFCEELCVRRSYSIPYVSQQNPYAERVWGIVLRKVRTALLESQVKGKFWDFAIRQAALIHNILCDESCVSPYERVHGAKYDYSELHVWGCLCYYLVPDRDRSSKLSPTALPAIYLGPDDERQGHKVYIPAKQRITSGYHVVFSEDKYFDPVRGFRGRTYFREDDGSITRDYAESRTTRNHAATQNQNNANEQDADAEAADIPALEPYKDPRHGTPEAWNENHCENTKCLYPRGHSGLCSHQEVHRRTRQFTGRIYCECDNPAVTPCAFYAKHDGQCKSRDGKPIDCDSAWLAQLHCDECDDDEFEYDDSGLDSAQASDGMLRLIFDDVTNEFVEVDLNDSDLLKPKSYDEATSVRNASKHRWVEAMRKEFETLVSHETWDYVSRNNPKLRGRQPTKSRWVYDIKFNRDGTIEKWKARFVVCGYSQRQGVDYDRAFSATLRATSFRTLLAIAAGKKLRLDQFDVTSAFTQADMDDVDLYVEPPKGFEVWETINGKRVSKLLHLRKALYGSKQASRLWQETLRAFLVDLGFVNSKAEPCIYTLKRSGSLLVVGVYVDDIIVAHKDDEVFDFFKKAFLKRFAATHMGRLSWFLKMHIDQHEDGSIDLNQSQYIEKMAAKYIPHNDVSRTYPSPHAFEKLSRAEDDVERSKLQASPIQYMSIIGSLLYVAVMSRPDVAYYTSVLAKFASDPSMACLTAAIQLLQYLHSTRNKQMHFSGKITIPAGLSKFGPDILRNSGFVAYSDSSWGNEHPYPMFGYGIYLYGGLVSYASKQLKTVAFSSCEAEYAAASYACKELQFIRYLCEDMDNMLVGRLVLAVDNTAVIDVAHDLGVSARTKHFARAMHYIRDLTGQKMVLPTHVTTDLQRADGYTKALDKSKFAQWVPFVVS